MSDVKRLRQEVRRRITNAYYDARNDGETMETAADHAADSVMEALPVYEAAVDALYAIYSGEIGFKNPHHPDIEKAREALRRLREKVPA